jgi:hypothetical protein
MPRIWDTAIAFEEDGDYVSYGYWNDEGWWHVSYWLIPGTELED